LEWITTSSICRLGNENLLELNVTRFTLYREQATGGYLREGAPHAAAMQR
jgi:hypothetical protein